MKGWHNKTLADPIDHGLAAQGVKTRRNKYLVIWNDDYDNKHETGVIAKNRIKAAELVSSNMKDFKYNINVVKFKRKPLIET